MSRPRPFVTVLRPARGGAARHAVRRALLTLLAALVLLRALVPAGFMPAGGADGGLAFCDGDGPLTWQAVAQRLAPMSMDDERPGRAHDGTNGDGVRAQVHQSSGWEPDAHGSVRVRPGPAAVQSRSRQLSGSMRPESLQAAPRETLDEPVHAAAQRAAHGATHGAAHEATHEAPRRATLPTVPPAMSGMGAMSDHAVGMHRGARIAQHDGAPHMDGHTHDDGVGGDPHQHGHQSEADATHVPCGFASFLLGAALLFLLLFGADRRRIIAKFAPAASVHIRRSTFQPVGSRAPPPMPV